MKVADFNGDGKSDLMSESSTPFIYLSSGSSFIKQENWGRPGPSPYDHLYVGYNMGDFNGDGKTDYAVNLCTDYPCAECGCQRYAIQVFTANSAGTGWNPSAIWIETTTPNPGPMNPKIVGDFNGDGNSDLLENIDYWPTMYCYYSTGTSFQSVFVQPPGRILSSSPILSADFNGDGKSDILILQGGVAYVGISQGTSFIFSVWGSSSYFGNSVTSAPDLNGDGKADLVQVNNASTYAAVWFSNGNSFESPVSWSSGFYTDAPVLVGDFNGDGSQDLMQRSNAIGHARVWLSNAPSDLLSSITQSHGRGFDNRIQGIIRIPEHSYAICPANGEINFRR